VQQVFAPEMAPTDSTINSSSRFCWVSSLRRMRSSLEGIEGSSFVTTIRPTVRFVIRYSPVMGSEVTDISFSERFGRDRSGWHGPAFLKDERLRAQGVSILDRGQVQHDSPEVPIAGLAIGFRSILSSHQAKHEIDVGAPWRGIEAPSISRKSSADGRSNLALRWHQLVRREHFRSCRIVLWGTGLCSVHPSAARLAIPSLFTPFAATFADVAGLVIHFTVALVVIHRSML
jgi:hypothetical protein